MYDHHVQFLDQGGIHHRIRVRLTVAAALASTALAPLVSSILSPPTMQHDATGHALVVLAWTMLAFPLGGAAMYLGLGDGKATRVFLRTLLAGSAFGMLGMVPAVFAHFPELFQFGRLFTVLAFCFANALGLFYGALVALVFLIGAVPGVRAMRTPTHDAPSRASIGAAGLLSVAALASAYLITQGELKAYRHAFSTLPCLLAALTFALNAHRERKTWMHFRREVLASEHAHFATLQTPTRVQLLPLTLRDLGGNVPVASRANDAYRTAQREVAIVRP